jgi:hypothetical protein
MKSLLQDHEAIIIHLRENIDIYDNEWQDKAPVILLPD